MLPFRTILHPTDFSASSEHALRLAEGLARDYSARLIVLHAIEPVAFSSEATSHSPESEQYRKSVEERISTLTEPGSPLTVETMLSEGYASAEIVRIAAEQNCGLIVIGSHGRSGLGRVLMGSVAEEVARKAPCPVLIVR